MDAEDWANATHAALLKVRVLRERLDDAEKHCEASTAQVSRLTEVVEQDRKALHDAMEELDTAAEEAAKLVTDDVTAAEAGVGDIAKAAHEAGIEGLQALDVESSALEAFGHHVQEIGPRVAALADAAEAASKAALARAAAIADELSQLVQTAEELLKTNLAAAVAEMLQHIETTEAEVAHVLREQCPQILLESEDHFGARMSEVQDLVDRVFPDLEKHADEVATYTVEKLEQLVDHTMDEVEANARTVEEAVNDLGGLATEKDGDIVRAGEATVKALHDDVQDAKAVEDAFADVRARWMTFGFAL
jgi:DNA repair exonuclease SbcCD ATPase subunit